MMCVGGYKTGIQYVVHIAFMNSVHPSRGVRYLSSALCFAADGTEFAGCTVPMSLFAESGQPRQTREGQVMDLYDQLRPSMFSYLAGLGLAVNETEDVIHDSFIRLFDHLATKESDPNLRGWIFRVAHNLAMDMFREARRIEQPDPNGVNLQDFMIDPSFTPEERAIKNEERHRVMSALTRLPPQQRSAVLLRSENLRYREIAAMLGISTKRVSELIQRALVRLTGDL